MHAQMYRRKASSFRGVYRCGKKWKSQIQIDGVQYYLGVFPTEDRAAEEYRIAARRLGKPEDVDYVQMCKEYAEGESDTDNINLSPIEISCSTQNNYAPSLGSSSSSSGDTSSNSNGGTSSSSSSSSSISRSIGGGSSSCRDQLPSLYIPRGSRNNVNALSPSMTGSQIEDRNCGDDFKVSFYLIPTNQLSLISSKVKLGKLGEEILELSRICDDASTVNTEATSILNTQKLIALRSAMFHSIQLIRNTSSSSQAQTRYKQFDITDDETMYEV